MMEELLISFTSVQHCENTLLEVVLQNPALVMYYQLNVLKVCKVKVLIVH